MRDPYRYSFEDTSGTYQFTTKNNIIYSVAFIEDSTLNSVSSTSIEFENMYQIIIEKLTEELESFDSQVFLTIDLIISDFFKSIQNALIYICSDDKGKDSKRFNAFNRWYEKSKHKGYITKIDNVIKFEETASLIYTSLLYHNDNPNINSILYTFNEIEEVINPEK
ncbi:hypothetical protein J2Q11_01340 [Tenacibaculum finnmarkense genomovar finnmarkense]|uniref:DUF6169 family protein n=1 Tax=Tenacibaculum finnmarkense TaxID=2781243 RepID=UPI001E590C9F|nr:DUF6169 family protein [Tenacibaculum finnmarkense]MCD8417060.1 DUF6169 family protein [Tenacibaculum finnmarkense genomovar finnmarkense]MCG8184547.1 hypothetical protein [Tenacibaculum finnmarkense genomovar finnmarkense]MCG8201992.1 hypothetical protein [Tenacibaculum finnmarkense genomovar finnmarkense]MCG8208747.1 hypothetical protein [Tenacibaculum finnmarkense genomovar finnmarkense]MCG8211478.1 hypothetical protein [Tenacibaculum finnmarkense genomovar finnmarkense]